MKKYFLTMATIALFAIGFAASDEEESSNNSSNGSSTIQTEQKQESEAERQAREQKEKEAQHAKKKEEMKEKGYKAGYSNGFSSTSAMYSTANVPNQARSYYTGAWGAPTNSEEKELFDIFAENYAKGFEDGYRAQ